MAFVADALALLAASQAAEPTLKHLAMSFTVEGLPHRSMEAAQGWIRDAVRSEVTSFVFDLRRSSYYKRFKMRKEPLVISLVDPLGSAKLETMRLVLGGARVRLPIAGGVFATLVDLSLEKMAFAHGAQCRWPPTEPASVVCVLSSAAEAEHEEG